MSLRGVSLSRVGLLGTASALVLAASITPTHAEQQLFNFFVNNLGNGGTGCCAQYQGPAYDSNHSPPGGFRTTSSGNGAISEVSGSGHGVNGGAVSTQLNDGYDGYGSVSLSSSATTRSGTSTIGPANFGGLSVTRNTQTTHGSTSFGNIGPTTVITTPFTNAGVPNAARFVDTITNPTNAPITGYFAYYNNLGSDSLTTWVTVGPNNTYLTSIQANNPNRSDPVLTHVFGNNAYTKNSVILTYANGDDNPQWNFPITVQPGQTITIMTFDIVTGTDNPLTDDPNQTADIALGAQEAQLITATPMMWNSPFLAGLSKDTILSIINFDINLGTIDTSLPFFTENDGPFWAGTPTFNGGILKPTTAINFSQNFTITANGGTVDNSNGNVTFSNVISGVGGLTLTGGNTTIFQAANTYQGPTNVNGGTLQIDAGASVAGTVNVASGGTLTGFGTIGALNNTAGIVQPGGAGIGTMNVTGNFTQGSGGTLAIAVSPTTASKLAVGGTATLGGTLHLIYAPGTYAAKTYTLLTASSVNGTFSSVTGTNPSGLSEPIVYGSNSVSLDLGGTIAPTNDTVFGDGTTAALLNAQQLNGMLLDRIGQIDSGIADGQFGALGSGSGLRATQFAQAGGNSVVLGEAAQSLPQAASQGAWFRGIGGFASVQGNGSAPSFSGSTGGFLAGYDRPVAPNLTLGIAGGYVHGNVNESFSSGTEESVRVAGYGAWRDGLSQFSGTIGYAHDWFDSHRRIAGIGTASENHGGDEATAAAQWARAVRIPGYGEGTTATLTPKVGVAYVHLSEDSFSEGGASGFDLSSSGNGTNSLQPYVGAALAQKFVTQGGTEITPEVRVSYAHDLYGSRQLTVTTASGSPFAVNGVTPSRDQLSAGLGLVVQATASISAYADYDAVLPTGNTIEQTLQAGLRIRF